MEIIGTIKTAQGVQTGTSQQGRQYKRQTIVIEYGDRYPKELALTLMNDKCDTYSRHLAPGQQLKFHFDVSSREYNGRYYTECMVWKVESLNAQPQQGGMPAPPPAFHAPQQNYAPSTTYAPPAPYAAPQQAYDNGGFPF